MLTFLTAEKKLHSLKIFYLHCLNYNKYVFCPGIFLIVNFLNQKKKNIVIQYLYNVF